MSNVFETPLQIHENYDLKGSTKDRTSTTLEGSKKDSDFRRKLFLGEQNKQKFLNQLNLDTEFLEKRNICDYSLLVGVCRLNDIPLKIPKFHSTDPSFWTQFFGGTRSVDLNSYEENKENTNPKETENNENNNPNINSNDKEFEVYFLGLIDILCEYDFLKKGETVIKGITKGGDISSIPPGPYRLRLYNYLSNITC